MSRKSNMPTTIFGKRMQDVRLSLGMSQSDLGLCLGIQLPSTAAARISRYEKGTHFPDPETLSKIAKALQIPLAYLFADNDRLSEVLLILARLTKDCQNEAVELLAAYASRAKQ